MKKVLLSTVAAAMLTTSAMAGDLVKELFFPSSEVQGVYIGIGASSIDIDMSGKSGRTADFDTTAPLFQLGWQYNKYAAFELRYQKSKIKSSITDTKPPAVLNGDLTTLDYSNASLFLKPQYTIKGFTGYALLGYGQIKADSDIVFEDSSVSGFQYGIGAEYALAKNVGIYVDYTVLYDGVTGDVTGQGGDDDLVVNTLNLGIKYKF